MSSADEEAVLAVVRRIPRGRVMTYGDIAEFAGVSSPRTVGRILAGSGDIDDELPWHRVLRADGTCAPHIRGEQVQRLRAEGVLTTGHRVNLEQKRWDGRPG